MRGDVKISLLTAGVTSGLIGADLYMKSSNVTMKIYQQAKNKGDEGAMKRALGYTTDSMSNANKSSKKAGKALEKAQKEAKEKAKAEREKKLEKNRQKDTEDQNDKQESVSNKITVDTVQISKEGEVKIDKNNNKSVDDMERIVDNIDKSSESINFNFAKEIYTEKGEVTSLSVNHKLLVTA